MVSRFQLNGVENISKILCLSVPVRVGEAVVHERGGRPHRLRGRGGQVILPRGRRPDTGKAEGDSWGFEIYQQHFQTF